MTDKYKIPLHPWEDDYDEKKGLYVIIQNGRSPAFALIDYSSPKPHDFIRLDRGQVYRVMKIMMSWMASETKLHNRFFNEYGEYRDD